MPCARSMSPQHPVAMAEPAMPATQTPPSASAARREIAEWRVWALSELAVFGFWLKSIGVGSGVRGSKSMSLIQASSFPVTVDSGALGLLVVDAAHDDIDELLVAGHACLEWLGLVLNLIQIGRVIQMLV